MDNWSALAIIKQVAAELGLPVPTTIVSEDPQITQLVALLNSAGNELTLYYPWEQFIKFHTFTTSNGVDGYAVPTDWLYYIDQTQWTASGGMELIGPKSPQEWSRLKGGVSANTGMRYRVFQGKIQLQPAPTATARTINIEYIKCNWVLKTGGTASESTLATQDTDNVQFHPWLMAKFLKLKFYELKGFDTTAAKADFMRMFLTLTGKDKGAPILTLVPQISSGLIGPGSIPEGSWVV